MATAQRELARGGTRSSGGTALLRCTGRADGAGWGRVDGSRGAAKPC